MNSIESTGKKLDDAIRAGLEILGVGLDEVDDELSLDEEDEVGSIFDEYDDEGFDKDDDFQSGDLFDDFDFLVAIVPPLIIFLLRRYSIYYFHTFTIYH